MSLINLPLRTAFAESHKFWVMFSLSFVSRNLLISFLTSSVTSLLISLLLNLREFVFFISVFFFPPILSIHVWLDQWMWNLQI